MTTLLNPPPTHSPIKGTQKDPQISLTSFEATRTVVLYTITDVYGLCFEEYSFAGKKLYDILEPLFKIKPHGLPVAVRHEMLVGYYTKELERFMKDDPTSFSQTMWDKNAVHATAQDVATVIMQMVNQCYSIENLVADSMFAQIVKLLEDLGVDHPVNPRPAKYLPSDVRHRLNHQ